MHMGYKLIGLYNVLCFSFAAVSNINVVGTLLWRFTKEKKELVSELSGSALWFRCSTSEKCDNSLWLQSIWFSLRGRTHQPWHTAPCAILHQPSCRQGKGHAETFWGDKLIDTAMSAWETFHFFGDTITLPFPRLSMIVLLEIEVLLKRLKDLSSHHGARATEIDMNKFSYGNLKFHQATPRVYTSTRQKRKSLDPYRNEIVPVCTHLSSHVSLQFFSFVRFLDEQRFGIYAVCPRHFTPQSDLLWSSGSRTLRILCIYTGRV
jgi:hypothetical protein